jgi:hypothetical protein
MVNAGATGTAANVAVSSPIHFVPLDRVLLLRNFLGQAIAGAAQNALSCRVSITDDQGTVRANLAIIRQAAGLNLDIDRHPGVWIPPGFGVVTVCAFDAGAVANTAVLTTSGVLFPRGNVQIGAMNIV